MTGARQVEEAAARPASPDPSAARHALVSVLAVAGVLLVLLLIGWAASTGRNPVFTGPGWDRDVLHQEDRQTTTPTASESASPTAEPEPEAARGTSRAAGVVLSIAAFVLTGLVLLMMVAGTLAAIRYFWRLRRARMLVPGDEIAFDEIDVPRAAARALVEDAEEQRRALSDGEARNAIVRCWERFETRAAAAGLPRRPWETSSEYVARALAELSVRGDAVRRLERLFVEARFSTHPIDEDHRRAALEALDAIHADLRRVGERE